MKYRRFRMANGELMTVEKTQEEIVAGWKFFAGCSAVTLFCSAVLVLASGIFT